MSFKGVLDVQRESLKGLWSSVEWFLDWGNINLIPGRFFILMFTFDWVFHSLVLVQFWRFIITLRGGSWLVLTAIEGEVGKYRMVGWDGTWFWEDFWFGNCSFDWVFHSLALDQWWRFIITLRCGSGNWSVLTVIEREGVLSNREKKANWISSDNSVVCC